MNSFNLKKKLLKKIERKFDGLFFFLYKIFIPVIFIYYHCSSIFILKLKNKENNSYKNYTIYFQYKITVND